MLDIIEQPSRVLPLDGGVNFRDLGGYETADGRQVRWRKIFRCGHLGELTARDLDALEKLQVTEIHDFRRKDEQLRTPSQPVRATFNDDYEMFIGSMSKFWEYLKDGCLTAESAHSLVVGSYRTCVEDVAPHYRRLFHSLLVNGENASVFHCSAGKDRTGLAAALILTALGVSREQVVDDYLLTREHYDSAKLIRVVEQHLRDADIESWQRSWLTPYCGVHRDNIDAFFEGVESAYGSSHNYLQQGLGLTDANLQELRRLYLQA